MLLQVLTPQLATPGMKGDKRKRHTSISFCFFKLPRIAKLDRLTPLYSVTFIQKHEMFLDLHFNLRTFMLATESHVIECPLKKLSRTNIQVEAGLA